MTDPKDEPRCPYCGTELVPMLGSMGCPLTQRECDKRAADKAAKENDHD